MTSLQELGLAVKRLQVRHHREANARLAAVGLSLAQWDVLRHLEAQPDASLHDLAVLTFQTDPALGSLAWRMQTRGLIERVPSEGRAIRHRITAEGQRARREGAKIMDGVFDDSFGRLSETERRSLARLLAKVSR